MDGVQFVFIDDSGDPGFQNSPSNNFVMACALFLNPETATSVANEIANFRRSLGWQENAEFKFRKTNKAILKSLLEKVAKFDFRVYGVYIDKRKYEKVLPVLDRVKLYNWAIKELLELTPIENAKIRIDGRSSKQNMLRTAAYLRKEINADARKIIDIRFEDSVKVDLIQLADVVAGAINRSLQIDKTDAEDYVGILRNHIAKIAKLDLG